MVGMWVLAVAMGIGSAAPIPSDQTCFVSHSSRTALEEPCAGELVALSQIECRKNRGKILQTTGFGAQNLADMILSRGAGIFDYHKLKLDDIHVCQRHMDMLFNNEPYSQNKRQQIFVQVAGRKRQRKFGFYCPLGSISKDAGVPGPAHSSDSVFAPHWLTKDGSAALMKYLPSHPFIPMGTPICSSHANAMEPLIDRFQSGETATMSKASEPSRISQSQPPLEENAVEYMRHLADKLGKPLHFMTDPKATSWPTAGKELKDRRVREFAKFIACASRNLQSESDMQGTDVRRTKRQTKQPVNEESIRWRPWSYTGMTLDSPHYGLPLFPPPPSSSKYHIQKCEGEEYRIYNVNGDGNCLFRALALAIHGDQSEHTQVRRDVVAWLRLHVDDPDFQPHLETMIEDMADDQGGLMRGQPVNVVAEFARIPLHDLRKRFLFLLDIMSKSGSWSGNEGLLGAANVYQVTIILYYLNRDTESTEGIVTEWVPFDPASHIVHLRFTGDHYKMMIPVSKILPSVDVEGPVQAQLPSRLAEELLIDLDVREHDVSGEEHSASSPTLPLSQPADVCGERESSSEGIHYLPEFRELPPLFTCPETACRKAYTSEKRLSNHLALGKHDYQPDSISLLDTALDSYGRQVERLGFDSLAQTEEKGFDPRHCSLPALPQGWALQQPAKATRYTREQRSLLQDIFMEGERTGKKVDAHSAVKRMRAHFKNEPQLWMKETAIQGFFSRFTKELKQRGAGAMEMEGDEWALRFAAESALHDVSPDDAYFEPDTEEEDYLTDLTIAKEAIEISEMTEQ